MNNKIELMHMQFGRSNGQCKGCSNFLRIQAGSRQVFKCAVYGQTASAASDWRAKWEACGMFNRDKSEAAKVGKQLTVEDFLNPA